MKTIYKVIEKNNNTIVREIRNLSLFQAENVFFQLINTNPVRQGYNDIKIKKQ